MNESRHRFTSNIKHFVIKKTGKSLNGNTVHNFHTVPSYNFHTVLSYIPLWFLNLVVQNTRETTDSTTSTTSGQTNGQMSTAGGQTDTTSGKTIVLRVDRRMDRWVLRVNRRVPRVDKRVLRVDKRLLRVEKWVLCEWEKSIASNQTSNKVTQWILLWLLISSS